MKIIKTTEFGGFSFSKYINNKISDTLFCLFSVQ